MQQQKASLSVFAVVVVLAFGSALAFRKQNSETSDPDIGDASETKPPSRWRPPSIGSFIPDEFKPSLQYSCEVKDLDRWVTVTPDLSYSKRVKQWLDVKEWGSWLKAQVGKSEQASEFTYDPFVLRNRSAYGGRLLLKTAISPGWRAGGDPCISSYEATCADSKLQLIKRETCGLMPATTEILKVGSFKKERVFCAKEGSKASWSDWNGKPEQRVFVIDEDGKARAVKTGNCVKIATVNPTNGLFLHDIDPDLMGNGFRVADLNESKLDALLAAVKYTVTKEVRGVINTVNETVVEAKNDLEAISDEFKENVLYGSVVAGKTSVKWASKAILDSMVDSCLCCDSTETYQDDDPLAHHCKAAYTLGGENKSHPLTYLAKATIGTGYNFAKKAGAWAVPYIGGTIVTEGQKMVCKFACSIREPKFEPYQYGRVRKVPGLAVQTWWIPLPDSGPLDRVVGNVENAIKR